MKRLSNKSIIDEKLKWISRSLIEWKLLLSHLLTVNDKHVQAPVSPLEEVAGVFLPHMIANSIPLGFLMAV